jgi:hypothetical protein
MASRLFKTPHGFWSAISTESVAEVQHGESACISACQWPKLLPSFEKTAALWLEDPALNINRQGGMGDFLASGPVQQRQLS